MRDPRFYVQDPHIDGTAILDREKGAMVMSSVSSRQARRALEAIANCLNAATSEDRGHVSDACQISPALSWRVIEYLSSLYRQERVRADEASSALVKLREEQR